MITVIALLVGIGLGYGFRSYVAAEITKATSLAKAEELAAKDAFTNLAEAVKKAL